MHACKRIESERSPQYTQNTAFCGSEVLVGWLVVVVVVSVHVALLSSVHHPSSFFATDNRDRRRQQRRFYVGVDVCIVCGLFLRRVRGRRVRFACNEPVSLSDVAIFGANALCCVEDKIRQG